jgi:uncharacterized protein (DUF427 family)
MVRRIDAQESNLSIDCPAVESTPRWIRVRFGNRIIADSKKAMLLRQYGAGRLPTYYFPQSDVDQRVLKPPAGNVDDSDNRMHIWTVETTEKTLEGGAWTYANPPKQHEMLRGYISFQWNGMDAWYEEDEEVYVHARDPYTRVDVLKSSRHVRVEINGQCLARSDRAFLLFETGLPTRYYLPRTDINMKDLVKSDLATHCPYKGIAEYWSLRRGNLVMENIVWSYPDPIPENPKIRGLMCFFNERLDIFVDDELLPRPKTLWS